MNTIDKQSHQNVQPSRMTPAGPSDGSLSPTEAQPGTAAGVAPVSSTHPLDGSQFHGIIDEQVYAELPPTPEEQRPRRARQLTEGEGQRPHPDEPAISVGPS